MAEELVELKDTLNEIKDALLGDLDGKSPGIITRLTLVEVGLGKAWWWLAVISVAIISAAFFVIRSSVT